MLLQVIKNTVQQDKLNPSDDDEAELVYWKRVKTDGVAALSEKRFPFTAMLDMRSRLLQVRVAANADIGAREIGDALVNSMCRFMNVPKWRIFSERAVLGPHLVEWMVTDAVHVSGLLHRLKEEKTFLAPASTPSPPALERTVFDLVDEVTRNLRLIAEWKYGRNAVGKTLFHIRFEAHRWNYHQARLMELAVDGEMASSFSEFFGIVTMMNQHIPVALTYTPRVQVKMGPPAPAEIAEGILFYSQDRAQRIGMGIIANYGTDAQRAADTGPFR